MTSDHRYQRGDLIGKGGQGSIYQGIDTHTDQPVALKFLLPELAANNPESVERFQREREALRQLDHPNIVKILEYCEIDAATCIVTELVTGGSLSDLIKTSAPLPVDQVLKIALELADALTRAHHLDIIHRDIKPDNILLAEDGTPRLTDFGLARLTQSASLTDERMIVGTLPYLSPEAINNEPLDEGTDIWAFGVTLFKMLTGIQPFRGETVGAICQAILRNAPDPDLEVLRPDVPLSLTDLIYRMLEKDRRLRIPTVRLVGAELWGILRGVDLNVYSQKEVIEEETFSFLRSEPVTTRPKHNLPTQSTPFIGREDDIANIISLLDDPTVRLVSIVGQGGMGKTRLALEMAEAMIGEVANGVYFVPFAGIDSPEFMVSAMMDALGLQGTGLQAGDGRPEASPLFDYLREKHILLVLDNVEQLLDGVELFSELLQVAPRLKILATSREKLNLRGETVFWLQGLDAPSVASQTIEDFSAVQLFLDRAALIQPDFDLSRDDEIAVAEICRMVEGMPLGIELAASWLDMLSPQEIAAEITNSLDFLESELRDLPDRHRSMRALFESTWQRLSDDERDVMMRLSVFRGGFTQHAATAVTGATLRTLRGLTNKSLLRRNEIGRYDIHELLRQFAAERLADDRDVEAEAHDRHSAYFLEYVAEREPDIKGRRQQEAFAELQVDFENIRVAWELSVSRNNVEMLRNAHYCLARYLYNTCDHLVGAAIFTNTVEQLLETNPNKDSILLGACMTWLAEFTWNVKVAQTIYKEGEFILRKLDARRELASALLWWGQQNVHQSVAESLSISKELDDLYGIACCLFHFPEHDFPADVSTLRSNFEKSLSIFRELGCKLEIALCLRRLGMLSSAVGKYDEALQYQCESLSLCRELNHARGVAASLNDIGLSEAARGNYEQSIEPLVESLQIAREWGGRPNIWSRLDSIATVHYQFGDYEQAKKMYNECLDIVTGLNATKGITFINKQLGFVELVESDNERAKGRYRTALHLSSEFRSDATVIDIAVGIAMMVAQKGNPKRALDLLCFTSQRPTPDRHRQDEQRLLAELEAELPPDVIAAAKKRADELTLDEVIEILWEELSDDREGE